MRRYWIFPAKDAGRAAESMLWRLDGEGEAEFRSGLGRLIYAVRHQRLRSSAVELLSRAPPDYERRHRPASISRVGGFVLRQLLFRSPAAGRGGSFRGDRGAATA